MSGFTPNTLDFLTELAQNNNREWFNAHKADYEGHVLDPALRFIEAMQAPLATISEHFVASPKRTGGSLMRVYRDTRFSRNKTPYKTNIGIQFRHERAKDVHAPGFYVHVEPERAFLGVGLWRPDARALKGIREFIRDNPAKWGGVSRDPTFRESFELRGDSLTRPPKGFSADVAYIEDIRRKDFIAVHDLDRLDPLDDDFSGLVASRFRLALPYMGILCLATGVPC
jgi:uncharacterized protein (TIGR02453 family)